MVRGGRSIGDYRSKTSVRRRTARCSWCCGKRSLQSSSWSSAGNYPVRPRRPGSWHWTDGRRTHPSGYRQPWARSDVRWCSGSGRPRRTACRWFHIAGQRTKPRTHRSQTVCYRARRPWRPGQRRSGGRSSHKGRRAQPDGPWQGCKRNRPAPRRDPSAQLALEEIEQMRRHRESGLRWASRRMPASMFRSSHW